MKEKLMSKEWADEFQSFASAEEVAPPRKLSSHILTKVRADLNPSSWFVFSKLVFIHLLVGTLTLLACPQLGINILPGHGLMAVFMKLGETGCTAACGAFFLGTSTFMASLLLRPDEIRTIRRTELIQIAALSLLSLAIFLSVGASTVTSLVLAWTIGSVVGALTTFEFGWIARRFFRRRLVYGQ